MSSYIGLRIGIEGEEKYKSQLNGIVQQTKTLKAEMKETTSAFDKNAKGLKSLKTNMEQAKAKAKNLTEQIKLQQERVAKTAEMTEKANTKYGEASTVTQSWKEKLALANAELHQMQAELEAIPTKTQLVGQAMQETGEKISKIGKGITSVGDTMTKGITAPIMAIGTAAIAAFNEVDAGYDALIAKTGASGDALQSMQDIVDNIATTIPTDFETVGDAVGEVNTRFHLTGQDLEDLSTTFLEFASINGTDVTSSVDTVQNALAAFSLDATSAGKVLDVLTRTSQATGADVDKMASSVVENATAFQQMGLDIYQSIDFMGQFETAGADSESVLSGLKRALKSATEQGIPFDQALSDLEDTIINGTGEMDGLTASYDLFGKSGAAVYQAVANGQISFTNLSDSATILDESIGATGDTFTATLDPIDQWKTTLNSLKLAGADIGATLGTVLVPIMNTVKEVVTDLKAKWEALSPATQESIVKAALFAAAAGPVISVIGRMTTGVGGLVKSVGGIIDKIKAGEKIMSPTQLKLYAIMAVIALIVLVITHWGEITDWIAEKWSQFVDFISGIWETITNGFILTWNDIKSGVVNAWNAITTTISTAWTNITTAVSSALNTVKTTVSNAWNNIKTTVSNALNSVKTTVSNAWNTVKTTISSALTGAYNTVVNKFNSIKTAITNKLNAAKTAVSNAITAIKNLFNFSWSLPTLKMPHFSISGGFSLKPLSVPSISVSWYKKAYSNPLMFTSPTVLSTSSGLKGFGDGRGGEIVIGQSMMYDMIKGAVRDVLLPSGAAGGVTVNVYGAEGQDVRELARLVSLEINSDVSGRKAVWA